jgi:hypothetical protein
MSTKATWINGKRKVTGTWSYYRPSDRFDIYLDVKDRITGQYKHVSTNNDTPEWGNWKLVREDK